LPVRELSSEAITNPLEIKPMSYKKALERIENEKRRPTGTLDLSNLGLIHLPKELETGLERLKRLNLRRNKIEEIHVLENLVGLRTLDLSGNSRIIDFDPLQGMINLKMLLLSSNDIVDLSFIENLINLKSLDLGNNRIRDFSSLQKLKNLSALNIAGNELENIYFLNNLVSLRTLNLHSNPLTDFSPLEKLTNLKGLNLSDIEISDPSFFTKLRTLKTLVLDHIWIPDFSFLKNLTNLFHLSLNNNLIADISFLKDLTNLTSIYLSNNLIEDLSPLGNLTELSTIDIANNQIHDLSPLDLHIREKGLPVFLDAPSRNESINVRENPILVPPVETISQGQTAIAKYFEDISIQGKAKLYEAKLLIVGDGGAGKTSLARKMDSIDNVLPIEGEDRTKGIDIQAMPIANIHRPGTPFFMNVWDFGGQGYYHSTHQFFLTKRSLYVLLNNTRINKTDFNNWLQTISLFSDNSPVIIVENEVSGSQSDLDERGLRQFFDNIIRVKVADISNIGDGRLRELIADIQTEIQRLPHVGSELPKQWVEIRKELKEVALKEAHISDQEFYKICAKHQIKEKEARQRLGDLFHDLGIFLHFREDQVLRRMVILQNSWATKGVYTILDSPVVRNQKGYFTIDQAEEIWTSTPYEEWYHEMVSLMKKFRLCYEIPKSKPAAYISPNLLPIEKPAYDWDEDRNLIVHYDYEFMPKGLLGMLIVELHPYVKDIKHLAWRSGCIFHYENTDAQVIETYGKRKLEIRIRGAHSVQLSTIIISEVDKLNASFKRIKMKKLVPCSCKECQQSESPQFYEYDDLMRRKAKRKQTIECSLSYEDVPVLAILEAAFDEQFVRVPAVKELIAKGELQEAIEMIKKDYPDAAAMFSARLRHCDSSYQKGIIDYEEWSKAIAQISAGLLDFLDREGRG